MSRICKVIFFVLPLVLASCGDGTSGTESGGTTTAVGAGAGSFDCGEGGEFTVAAAASLTEVFERIGQQIEAACPDVQLTFTFDSSGTLAQQILDGAPVDVFASADEANVEKVADLATAAPIPFARNQLTIVTKPANPEGIEELADLRDVGVVSLCATDAPCGRFAGEVLEAAGVTIDESYVTRGQNAKATVTAVSEGDAVAGIVYVTDANAAGDAVTAIELPVDQNVVAAYPVVTLDGPAADDLATAFATYLTGDDAQAVLGDAGFSPPS
jgi:molybdate transport system substrate-binding protein